VRPDLYVNDEYDPAIDTWRERADMPHDMSHTALPRRTAGRADRRCPAHATASAALSSRWSKMPVSIATTDP
jgi:hypothetical protein